MTAVTRTTLGLLLVVWAGSIEQSQEADSRVNWEPSFLLWDSLSVNQQLAQRLVNSLPCTVLLNLSEMEPDLHRNDAIPNVALGPPGVLGRYPGLTCCLK